VKKWIKVGLIAVALALAGTAVAGPVSGHAVAGTGGDSGHFAGHFAGGGHKA